MTPEIIFFITVILLLSIGTVLFIWDTKRIGRKLRKHKQR